MSASRLAAALLFLALPVYARDDDDDDDDDQEMRAPAPAPATQIDFAPMELRGLGYIEAAPKMELAAPNFSAKAGGVQDIASFRSSVMHEGILPQANLLFSEGLFSEYDLPARRVGPCDRLLCPLVEAAPAELMSRPEVAVVAQIGFDSSLNPATWERPPLSLVVVVDVSGSMGGDPIRLARESLAAIASQLRPQDQIAILQADRSVRVVLPLVGGGEQDTIRAAASSTTQGGSNLLEALDEAFKLAEREMVPDGGLVRVIALTDYLPNAGATYSEAFVAAAEKGARKGIGLTGVALGQGADLGLAESISRVRGGNLVTVPNAERAREAFGPDFDSLVTPLANDFSLEILPASGWRLVGVYGIPGAALRWDESGSARLSVATLFLSTKAGAIYLAFAPETVSGMPSPPVGAGGSIGTLGLSFTPLNGYTVAEDRTITLEDPIEMSVGLSRGLLLIDEVEALRSISVAYHGGDAETARALALRLVERFAGSEAGLLPEVELVQRVLTIVSW